MSYINFLRRVFKGTASDNTGEGAIIRSGGKTTTKVITLNANNTTASVNCFEVTGVNEILSLHAEVVDATTLNNCTNVHFVFSDGISDLDLTNNTGANINGFGVGGFLIKEGTASVALSTANSNTVNLIEGSTGTKAKQPFVLIANSGATCYIQFHYTTNDTPINAQLKVVIAWADIDNGQITAA